MQNRPSAYFRADGIGNLEGVHRALMVTGRDEPELKPWSWGCWPSWNLRGRVPAADQSFGTPVLRAPKGCREDGQPVDASRYWVCRLARSNSMSRPPTVTTIRAWAPAAST